MNLQYSVRVNSNKGYFAFYDINSLDVKNKKEAESIAKDKFVIEFGANRGDLETFTINNPEFLKK